MEFANEYALLIVVVLPAAVISAMNMVLAFAGESGTLLLPSRGELPVVRLDGIDVTPASSGAVVASAANDELRSAA